MVESMVSHVGLKPPIGDQLGWDAVPVKAVAYALHFITHQTIQ